MSMAGHSPQPLSIDVPLCLYVDLDRFAGLPSEQVLSDEERERAESFRSPLDRQRYVASHLALRQALSEYTGLQHAELHLSKGSFGKPSLTGHARTQFSLSHSQGLALIAIGGRGPLGADIELLRPVPDAAVLAAEHFTRREQEALAALPVHERDRAFLKSRSPSRSSTSTPTRPWWRASMSWCRCCSLISTSRSCAITSWTRLKYGPCCRINCSSRKVSLEIRLSPLKSGKMPGVTLALISIKRRSSAFLL